MREVYRALLELQELDEEIDGAEQVLASFAPRLETLEAPVLGYEREVAGIRERLTEMRSEIRRLEKAADQKRERLRNYEERLNRVRNAREESAARTELDLIRHAVDADEQEALELHEQATRADLRLDELEKQLEIAREQIAPQKEQLVGERTGAEQRLEDLRSRRRDSAAKLSPADTRLYERARSGKRKRVLAAITHDGACGQCYNVLPIQQQSEVRQGRSLVRCEGCGVILYAAE
jgi:predicted  nucleic acid-binding Zn-ribbon protein